MNKKQLKFNNGKFKIMLLGDLHEHFDTIKKNGAAKLNDTLALLNKAAMELEPDLVVFLGDNASAENEEQMRTAIGRIVEPFEKRNIPFALVFGNHDHDNIENVDLKTQMKLYNEHKNCYFFNADDSITGCGNFNLPVKATDSDKDILNLWFIDSNNLCDDRDISYYDWVHEDQIEWYKKTAKELADKNGGKVIPSLLFQHAPVPEEYELLREAKPYEYFDSVEGHGIWSDKRYVLKDCFEGYLGEGPCSPCFNSSEFAAWKETGDVMGAFFGHDHMNDFAGYVDGILLAQSKTAGFRVYTDGCNGGVRLITLDENNIEDINTRMYYFKKDFGLTAASLSPYMRRFTDRQDIKFKTAGAVLGTAAGITVASVAAYKIAKALKK